MDTMVSIICITYNHEKYIKEALDSFLNQKTTFKYEVIVHDDASTDNTAAIIREYESKYPDIIKPIYQTENKYSQKISVTINYALPKAKGKYIALCEGDDYWIDEYKLQKQIDYMENHPECTLCINNAVAVNDKGDFIENLKTVNETREVSCEEVILGGGGFCATNSIVYPRYLTLDIPGFLKSFSLDYLWQMYTASQGSTYCFSDIMSARRRDVEGSWTKTVASDTEKMIEHRRRLVKCIEEFNSYTNYKYDTELERVCTDIYFNIYSKSGEFEKLKDKRFKNYIKSLPLKRKIGLMSRKYFPSIYKLLK